MSKVTFRHRGGREQVMPEKFAKVLQALGRGSYDRQGAAVAVIELPVVDYADEALQVAETGSDAIANGESDFDRAPGAKRGRKPKAQE